MAGEHACALAEEFGTDHDVVDVLCAAGRGE
jgi:hypothetical protein